MCSEEIAKQTQRSESSKITQKRHSFGVHRYLLASAEKASIEIAGLCVLKAAQAYTKAKMQQGPVLKNCISSEHIRTKTKLIVCERRRCQQINFEVLYR